MMKDNPCGKVVLYQEDDLKYCDVLFNGLSKQGIIKFEKEFVVSMEKLLSRWELSRDNWEETKLLLNSDTFLSILGRFGRLNRDIYYFLTDSGNTVATSTIDSKIQQSDSTRDIIILFYILMSLLFIFGVVIRGLRAVLRDSFYILELVPMKAMAENTLLINITFK